MPVAEEPSERERGKHDRLQLRKALDRLGWKWVNRTTVAIRCEREVALRRAHGGAARTGRSADTGRADAARRRGRRGDRGDVADRGLPRAHRAHDRRDCCASPTTSRKHTRSSARCWPTRCTTPSTCSRPSTGGWPTAGSTTRSKRSSACRSISPAWPSPSAPSSTSSARRTRARRTPRSSCLRAAERGAYLAPLRLLALEVYERLNELGVATSLVTGEERLLVTARAARQLDGRDGRPAHAARRRGRRRGADARGRAARLGLDAGDRRRARAARRAVRLGGRAARGAAAGARSFGAPLERAALRAQEPAARRSPRSR